MARRRRTLKSPEKKKREENILSDRRRDNRNRQRRFRRIRAKLKVFVEEYAALCRKHGCYIVHLGASLSAEPYWGGKRARAWHNKDNVEAGLLTLSEEAAEWWESE